MNFFDLILIQPLFNGLILLYQYLPVHNLGMAIIAFSIIIRVLLYPLTLKSIKSQKNLSELQPKIQEIQSKYKGNKEKQSRATMELYKKEKMNPFGGCLPLLIQLPILFAIYRLIYKITQEGFQPEQYLYSFVHFSGQINTNFLGIINLAQPCTIEIDHIVHYLWPNIILAILVGITQFFQTKMVTPKTPPSKTKGQMTQFSNMFQKQMLYFFPVITVFILWRFPAALALYWIVTSLFSIFQQRLVFAKKQRWLI